MSLEDMSVEDLVGAEEVLEDDNVDINAIEEEVEEDEYLDDDEVIEDEVPEEPELKKYKVKVDGVESEVTEEELIKNYQLESASRKRLEESSKQLKTLTEALKVGRDNPDELLAWLGVDLDAFLKKQVKAQLDYRKMSPEQRELAQYRQEKQKAELNKREQEAERMRQEQEAQYNEIGNKLENEIMEALGERKASKALVSDVARIMLNAMENKREVTAKEAVALALKDTSNRLQSVLSESDIDFLDSLDPSVREQIRKKLLSKAQPASNTRRPSQQADKSSGSKKARKSNFNDLFNGSRTL